MPEIEVELKYWKSALEKIGKFNSLEEDIRNISKKYLTDISVGTKDAPELRSLQKVIKISGNQEPPIRNSIRDIVLLFGKPDLPTFAFGRSKKRGKEIAKSIVDEIGK